MFNIHALGVLWKPPSGDFNTSIVCLSTIVETNFALLNCETRILLAMIILNYQTELVRHGAQCYLHM